MCACPFHMFGKHWRKDKTAPVQCQSVVLCGSEHSATSERIVPSSWRYALFMANTCVVEAGGKCYEICLGNKLPYICGWEMGLQVVSLTEHGERMPGWSEVLKDTVTRTQRHNVRPAIHSNLQEQKSPTRLKMLLFCSLAQILWAIFSVHFVWRISSLYS